MNEYVCGCVVAINIVSRSLNTVHCGCYKNMTPSGNFVLHIIKPMEFHLRDKWAQGILEGKYRHLVYINTLQGCNSLKILSEMSEDNGSGQRN